MDKLIIEKLYFNSPVLLQNILTSIYGYKLYRERYSGNHDTYLAQIMASQFNSEEEMRKHVEKKFMMLFQHAVRHVPYYRNLVQTGKIKIDDIRGISDLGQLPIIKKEQIRVNPDIFLADSVRRNDLITINTSGTTGKTLKIYVDKDSRKLGYSFFSRLKIWAGIDSKRPNVTFAGRTIIPPGVNHPPFWRSNIITNNYLFSSYHLSPENLIYYVGQLKKIQPHFIDSYPSSIYMIARYMRENNISGVFPKAIITSSETLLDYQRKIIEETFNCPVFDQYGAAEQVVFISQCEKGTYHVHPEFGIVEFLREDGSRAAVGEVARLICTGFTNAAMPLIRYDIGDSGVLSDKKCSCGRNFPVVEQIVGRTDDLIITRDGRRVGRLDPVFKGLQSIKEAQIVQEDYDKITLYIVPGNHFQSREVETVLWELEKRLGNQTKIRVEMVKEIEKTERGKFRSVVSRLKKE
jgi:phenylacetate-CoA ligase